MALFRIVRGAPLPAAEAWRRLTDWHAHAALVPLTRATAVTAGPVRTGSRFTMRTGIGPVGFDDPMEVVHCVPPGAGGAGDDGPEAGGPDAGRPGAGGLEAGRPEAGTGVCRLEKRGRVITGWAEIEVRPTAPGAVRVTWTEEVRVRGLPRMCDAVVARAGRLLFGRALSGLLADN
ncbi:SRPBCC family protein [Streptomyces ficellus]|uniref:SRPBCC family protein n=1 Tax=Streptomyces ficellus TaxID=1977088 RepID=A0A6I6FVD6_9ACTN|nr:SRPBCC family protein [Streptomyces ficellus]QGV81938.1 SRPBCC family protein [Streptomyces ficellus]